MEPLLEGLLRSLGGSEANFLELCFGRIPCGNFQTKATSKKSRPPSGNFRRNPPELPRSPSRSFSSREAGRKTVLIYRSLQALRARNRKKKLKKGLLGGSAEKSPMKGPVFGSSGREAMKQKLVQGHTRRRSLGTEHQQHPKPENQDSQNKLKQPKGSFPE